MTREDPIVIVSAVRTPMGGFLGDFKDVNAATLGAAAVRAAVERARLQADEVDEAVLGCVLAAGQGQAPARQAVLGAGLARGTPCSTLNKMCGSGMKALMLAHDTLLAGSAGVALAGAWKACPMRPTCWSAPVAATAWATARCSTTCSSTASKTPTTRAA